jgi:hypothetical protein
MEENGLALHLCEHWAIESVEEPMVGKGCSRVLVQQRPHTAPSRAHHALTSTSICIWRNTASAHVAQRARRPASSRRSATASTSDASVKSTCRRCGAPRTCVSVSMCMCVYVDVGVGVDGVGACGFWNIPQANWSVASVGSSGGMACVCARPPAVCSAMMVASGKRGWGHGDVRAWLLGMGHEWACGCERRQSGLLPRRFAGERDEHETPCDCDAPVVGACGVRGDVIASCLAGEVVTCVEHVKGGEPVRRGGCRFAGAHGEGGVSGDDVAKEEQCNAKGGSLLANTPT